MRSLVRAYGSALACCIVAATPLACDDAEARDPTGGAGQGGAGQGGAPASGTGGQTAAAFVEEEGPTDGEIVNIVRTSNDSAILTAERVVDRLRLPLVREYAVALSEARTISNESLDVLVAQSGIEPLANDFSFDLGNTTEQAVALLELADDAILDDVYLETQVSAHEYLLSLLETHMLPAANDPRLVDFLEATETTTRDQLEQAQNIRENIGPLTGG